MTSKETNQSFMKLNKVWLLLASVLVLMHHGNASLVGRFTAPLKMKTGECKSCGLKGVLASAGRNSSIPSFSYKSLSKPVKAIVPEPKKKEKLTYFQTMMAGAISRTVSQAIVHPINTYKTLLQLKRKTGTPSPPITFRRLLKGMDAQFYLSLPHGAFHFFVIDKTKSELSRIMPAKLDFLSDFAASAISTVVCSVISTPQMVLADRLMAGMYPNLPSAFKSVLQKEGLKGFYAGWWPALAQKIPSYGITWVAFQQMKAAHVRILKRKPSSQTNFVLGAIAAATSVSVMIPMDTIKTRIVTQGFTPGGVKYKGVVDCFVRVLKEEGVGAFYRALAPRLISVVPMMAIQFGIYELCKKQFHMRNEQRRLLALDQEEPSEIEEDDSIAGAIRKSKALLKM